MLAAAERWGGGDGRAPVPCRAPSRSRATRRRVALPARGRRPRHQAPVRAARGRSAVGARPARAAAFSAPRGGPPRDPRRRRRGHRAAGDPPGLSSRDRAGEPTVLLGFRDGAHAHGAALLRDAARRHRRRLRRPPRPRHRPARGGARRATPPRPSTRAGRRRCSRGCARCASARETPAQLALEAGMACGFGACFGCVVPSAAAATCACASTGRCSTRDELERVEEPTRRSAAA